ncbi:hypothetical protein C5167_005439 [Papaver somniferum]|uniref:Glycosyltransferase 61 catalytic domain-containing protein n=1 Tax=Papaver somniferum TaxID=3469 RepID=A0A4Y7JAJ6_PAPSO|nr:uncharacterized protein LOC113275441 [Papaver somniferum]RZC58133.1 hypothetical protein C5167_005439 [Papaver somniferum]
MENNAILAKSFSRKEQKKLSYGALLAFFVFLLTCFTVFKPSFSHLPILNSRLSINAARPRMLQIDENIISRSPRQILNTKMKLQAETNRPACNILEPRSDYCDIEGDIRIHGKRSTVLFTSPRYDNMDLNESWRIRPYARKGDKAAMTSTTELSVESLVGNDRRINSVCSYTHGVPAIIFSLGGYAGNQFHDFTDILVPLFITSYQFHQQVQLLVKDFKPYWIAKYRPILKQLSKYPIINMDNENNVHCYGRVIVGLKHHKEFGVDPFKSPKGYSVTDFTQFLRKAYSLNRSTAITINEGQNATKKPRLLIVSRKGTRKFTNEEEIANMASSMGYEVVVAEPGVTTTPSEFARTVNSCDVMMGVHGAGLTNLAFLPTNAVVIQIIPLGGLEWLSRHDFGEPAVEMKLRYLEYKIREEESSLMEVYPRNHVVFRDPTSFAKLGWEAVKSVYLEKQNVKLDVASFRVTLVEALKLLHS